MSEIAWQVEHSVETDASRNFAWNFMTDPRNWDDPPAQFVLDGPFADGSEGTTVLPDQEPVRWCVRHVQPGRSYVIESPLDGAMLSFHWCFDAMSAHKTRLTQRIVLLGGNAAAYVEGVKAGFGPSLPAGMNRIAAAIAAAQAADSSTG